MRASLLSVTTLAMTLLPVISYAATMHVTVDGIEQNAAIPMKHALCEATPDGKSTEGENFRPTIEWSGAPEATKSYVVLVKDPDVPADFADAGKEGKRVAKDAPRQLFYHWALADIPAGTKSIAGGLAEEAPEIGTKATGSLGDYVEDAHNYGGPCPPWNDERVHRYHFNVYALDVAKLTLPADPTAKDVEAAMKGHVLAEGSVVGTYTLNRALMK